MNSFFIYPIPRNWFHKELSLLRESDMMKKAIWTLSTLAMLSVLLLAAFSSAVEFGNNEKNRDKGVIPETEMDISPEGEEGGDINFTRVMRSSYYLMTASFIRNHSHWNRLPAVKSIFTADSPGTWIKNNSERLNGTGRTLFMDRDKDGNPEIVIWMNRTNSTSQINRTSNISGIGNVSGNLSLNGYALLLYLDMDDDSNPELLFMYYRTIRRLDTDGDGIPEGVYKFSWQGKAFDVKDDGTWNMQWFNARSVGRYDGDSDGNPEYKSHESSRYHRKGNGTYWNRIYAGSSGSMMMDNNSDGNPERFRKSRSTGTWVDRNTDHRPEKIVMIHHAKGGSDNNTDGNPEMICTRQFRMTYMDKNSDGNPEMFYLSRIRTCRLDSDSDGDVDLIRVKGKIWIYLDRNSDGDPEKMERKVIDREYEPESTRKRIKDLAEKIRKRISQKRGKERQDK